MANVQAGSLFPGDAAMKIDGRCHCGFIAYEAEADPEMTGVCHCTDCQTREQVVIGMTPQARQT